MSEDKTGCVAFCVRMVRIVLRLAITRIRRNKKCLKPHISQMAYV